MGKLGTHERQVSAAQDTCRWEDISSEKRYFQSPHRRRIQWFILRNTTADIVVVLRLF